MDVPSSDNESQLNQIKNQMESLRLSPKSTTKSSKPPVFNLNTNKLSNKENSVIENVKSPKTNIITEQPSATSQNIPFNIPRNEGILKYNTNQAKKISSLETIFEEVKEHQGKIFLMSRKKMNRKLDLRSNKQKSLKRQMKVKAKWSSSSVLMSCIERLHSSNLEKLKMKLKQVENV